MKIALHAGHGKTPPGDFSYARRGHSSWYYQRGWQELPGGVRWIEDLATAEMCSLLIPELVKRGHQVYPMRAMDPVTGELDRRKVSPGQVLPGLPLLGDDEADERWKYCGAVEAALRHAHGSVAEVCPPSWWRARGSYDPPAMLWQERRLEVDIYLSLHFNWYTSAKVYGFSAHHHPGSSRGSAMAHRIYQGVLCAFSDDPWTDRAKLPWGKERLADGCRWAVYAPSLWELYLSRAPAVILELAFFSNPEDQRRIVDSAWQQRMVEGIAKGIGL